MNFSLLLQFLNFRWGSDTFFFTDRSSFCIFLGLDIYFCFSFYLFGIKIVLCCHGLELFHDGCFRLAVLWLKIVVEILDDDSAFLEIIFIVIVFRHISALDESEKQSNHEGGNLVLLQVGVNGDELDNSHRHTFEALFESVSESLLIKIFFESVHFAFDLFLLN